MGYTLKKTLRVDLSELGDNQGVPFFVEIKNPKMMPVDKQMEFAELGKSLQSDDAEAKAKAEGIGKLLQSIIVSWNLLDIDTDMPINPTEEGAINRVPGEVMAAIFQGISKNNEKTAEDQKNS